MVEDDAALRTLVRVNLELEGFEVADAGTYRDADAAIAVGGFDVVLLDVHLCGRDTHDLLDRLRASGVPVALVTGVADAHDQLDRADAVLRKPFDPAALVELAQRLARVRA